MKKGYALESMKLKDESDDASESEDAASDILAAFKAGDAKSLDLALQRHYACCSGMSDGEDEDDEEEV